MSKPASRVQSFMSRNKVAIVMIPSIIGLHIGWSLMQKNRHLVAEHEEIEMPAILFAKYCWKKFTGIVGDP